MQDILLEPYGGEVLGMSVSATTGLSALWGTGMLIAFASASRQLGRGATRCACPATARPWVCSPSPR
jgi:BCD family chlorophyll transporter-like MFS transporter